MTAEQQISEQMGDVMLVYPETKPWEIVVVGPRGNGKEAVEVSLSASRYARAAAIRFYGVPVPEGVSAKLIGNIEFDQFARLKANGREDLANALRARYTKLVPAHAQG